MRELLLKRDWAMDLEPLTQLVGLYEGYTAGDKEAQRTVLLMLSESRREARRAGDKGDPEPGYTVRNGVGLARFSGVVTKEATCLGSFFGGDLVTTELIRVSDAMRVDREVRRVMAVFDTPGGTVDGTEAAAEAFARLNAAKPVTAYVDGSCCSAGWWIASQASRRVGDPTATTASMGVYAALVDSSRAYENRGVKVRLVKSAPGKGVGAPGTVVTDDQVASVQREVDAIHEVFVQRVAKGLGISIEKARAMADGEPRTGAAALALGYLDEIAHFADAWDALVAEANAPTRVFLTGGSTQGSTSPVVVIDSDVSTAPEAEPAAALSSEVVARLSEQQEVLMSDPTPTAPQAPSPAPAASAPAASSTDEVVARVNRALDENQTLRERLAALEKEKADASTEALLKAHEDKFFPTEAHRAAARTIAASFPAEFALLMGAARAVRPKAGAAPVYKREAGDGEAEKPLSVKTREEYLAEVEASAGRGRSMVSVLNEFESARA